MKPLREVIEAIRRELPEGAQTHASATLQCVVIEKGGTVTIGVVTSADLPGLTTHAVTVSLARGSSEQPAAATAAAIPVAQNSDGLRPILERMFGPPGFDNAARASVFCEIVDGLAQDQLSALLQNLRDDKTEVPLQKHPDAAVAMARTAAMMTAPS